MLMGSSPAWAVTTTLTKVTPTAIINNSTEITFEMMTDTVDAYLMCSLDSEEPVHCTSPWTYKNLKDGRHGFRVFSYSPTAGLDRVGSTHSWFIDTIAPVTTINVTTVGVDSYNADLFSSEANSSFVCSIDNSPVFSCRTPYLLQGFLPGHHDFKTFAMDEAGNVDPVGVGFAFTVVSRIPLTTAITNIDPAVPYTNVTHITFDFVSSQPASSFVCSLAGISSPCTPPYSYSGLADGNYTFKVQAVDVFGSIDAVGANYSWTVDTTPPTGIVNKLEATSTIATVTWTTNEPATTELHWGLNQDLSRIAVGSSNLTTNHSVQIMGLSSNTPYSLLPSGVDRAGNWFQMSRVSVRTKR